MDRTRAPLCWEGGVLAAEPPGKSLQVGFKRAQHDLACGLKRDGLGDRGAGM